jgi:hypothetical protein
MTRIEIILKESEEKVKIWLVLVRYGRTALLTMNGMIFIQNLTMKNSDHPAYPPWVNSPLHEKFRSS